MVKLVKSLVSLVLKKALKFLTTNATNICTNTTNLKSIDVFTMNGEITHYSLLK